MPSSPLDLPFTAHLEELRSRLLRILLAVFIAALAAFPFLDPVISFVIKPVGRLVFTSPAEAFHARVMLAVVAGVLLALPYATFQIWSFVGAGLTIVERRYVLALGPLSFALFLIGAILGYCVIVPMSLNFLLGFSAPAIVPMITVDKYVSFVGTLVIASGIAFELPLILAFLGRIGIVTPEFLIRHRRYAIVAVLIVSAVITPPDVISQILLAAPLFVLYEAGIFFCRWSCRSRGRA